MSNTLQPRQVKPGYGSRWFTKALLILFNSPFRTTYLFLILFLSNFFFSVFKEKSSIYTALAFFTISSSFFYLYLITVVINIRTSEAVRLHIDTIRYVNLRVLLSSTLTCLFMSAIFYYSNKHSSVLFDKLTYVDLMFFNILMPSLDILTIYIAMCKNTDEHDFLVKVRKVSYLQNPSVFYYFKFMGFLGFLLYMQPVYQIVFYIVFLTIYYYAYLDMIEHDNRIQKRKDKDITNKPSYGV